MPRFIKNVPSFADSLRSLKTHAVTLTRNVQGLVVQEVPYAHLSDMGRYFVDEIRLRRQARNKWLGLVVIGFAGLPVQNEVFHAVGGAGAGGVKASNLFIGSNLVALRDLHSMDCLVQLSRREKYRENIAQVKATHLAVGKEGQVFFIGHNERNGLQKLLSDWPVHTFRIGMDERRRTSE